MKMYAFRSNFSTSQKEKIFGEKKTTPIKPPPFTDYVKSFAYVPSWQIFKDLVCKFLMSLNQFETKAMQGTDGQMFKGDASHKVTKLIYVNTDEKVYHGLYTLMNEFSEVIGWWFIRTGKMEELEDSIRRLKKRYEMHNFDRPVIVYSDRPEMDRSIWEKIWPTLKPDVVADTSSFTECHNSGLETLCFPISTSLPTVIYKSDECCGVVNRIRELIEGNAMKVLGFDLEWNRGSNPAATIQISFHSGLSFIFCLKGILGKR